MRLILTSDWQTDFHNLDSCAVVLQELLVAAKKYQPDAILHLGDLKEAYNPLDIRVAKFWVRATREIRAAGHRFIVLMGNHDRISQSHESKHWLDILQAAGAEIVTRPKVKKISDVSVAFLPFTADRKQEKHWAKQLFDETKGEGICCFHTGISGATMGAGRASEGSSIEDLRLDKYWGAFGGHLHDFQAIDRTVYYVGSPFVMDWGEVNSSGKGHLLVDVKENGCTVSQLKTSVPLWYDIDYLERRKQLPEPGAHIRSRVPVTTRKITQQLRAEEVRIKAKYKGIAGLRLYVVPKMEASPDQDVMLKGSSTDAENVAAYVSATWSDGAKGVAEHAVGYLTSVLSKTPPSSRGKQLEFVSVEGGNVLSFEKVSINYKNQGLVLLQGKNKDWVGRSNGAGKTGALSLLPIALYGETLKGQKTDAWANERTEGPAWVRLVVKDERKRELIIRRSRRPHSISLLVDGKDESSGLRGTGKTETQGLIEQLTGFDRRLLLNAVYLDQTVANGFVFGSQAARLDLVSKLQNLERFDTALKLVGKDLEKHVKAKREVEDTVEQLMSDVLHYEDELDETKEQTKKDWEVARAKAQKEVTRLVALKASLSSTLDYYKAKQTELDSIRSDRATIDTKLTEIHVTKRSYEDKLRRAKKLVASGKCANCEQDAENVGVRWVAEAAETLSNLDKERDKHYAALRKVNLTITSLCTEIDNYNSQRRAVPVELAAVRQVLEQAELGAEQEAKRNAKVQARRSVLTAKLQSAKRGLKAAQDTLHTIDVDRELLEYAKKAFHRSGMPMYLSAALCPVLNMAAEEYADMFYDGALQVRFAVEDGDFTVDVVNQAGSITVHGQSTGESAMAGIIAALALREIAPKTNLLIMDEPANGLDPEAAKQFAKGLLRLKDRFKTIIVTTHSPFISGLLQGEKIWTVTKKHGMSTLRAEE